METQLDFDVWHEDGLLFEMEPDLFVHLDATPIVFTTRGIAYFSPRFKHIGQNLSSLHTRSAFESAMKRWLAVEWVMLNEKIHNRANSTSAPNSHKVLQAVMTGDIDEVERQIERLEHQARADLKIVGR
jgi:hypothetical protein